MKQTLCFLVVFLIFGGGTINIARADGVSDKVFEKINPTIDSDDGILLFEQPLNTNIKDNFYVPLAGPPPHHQGPENVFGLTLWQTNPKRVDQKLGPSNWDVGDKTGFYPKNKSNQISFEDTYGSTSAQAEDGIVGAYLNPDDETPDTDLGKMMITPSVRWPLEKARIPFKNDNAAIDIVLDLQVPTAWAESKAGSIAYVVADTELIDQISKTKISLGDALFHCTSGNLPKDMPVGFDEPSQSVMVNTFLNPENPKVTLQTDSSSFSKQPWKGWRRFHYQITAKNFEYALRALKERFPESKASENIADYKLTMFHLNAEINHAAAPAGLGWSMKNLKITLL